MTAVYVGAAIPAGSPQAGSGDYGQLGTGLIGNPAAGGARTSVAKTCTPRHHPSMPGIESQRHERPSRLQPGRDDARHGR